MEIKGIFKSEKVVKGMEGLTEGLTKGKIR